MKPVEHVIRTKAGLIHGVEPRAEWCSAESLTPLDSLPSIEVSQEISYTIV